VVAAAKRRGSEALEVDVALPGGLAVRARAWVEADGAPWLGYGRVRLLRAVDEHGSISAAARAEGMSYRHAWALIDKMNRLAPRPLVTRTVGGKGGGGAELTPDGSAAIDLYERLDRELQSFKKTLTSRVTSPFGREGRSRSS